MMKSNEWREWYLTSDGWVQGSLQLDFNKKEIVNPPTEWFIRGVWSETNSGPLFNKLVIERELAKGQTQESISSLIREFGDVPNSLF